MMSVETRQPNVEIHLKEYLRLFFKHRWLIAAVFIVTAVTGTIWTFLQTPIYQASATVLIEPELPKVLNIQEVTSPGLGTLELARQVECNRHLGREPDRSVQQHRRGLQLRLAAGIGITGPA